MKVQKTNTILDIRWFSLFVLCLASISLSAQFNNLKFESITTNEGLSSSTCLEIFQDNDGYLWFGTIDGLNKYNGYSIEVFRPNPESNASISNIRINTITNDKYGNLWIGTNKGLDFLDNKTKQFYRIDIFKYNSKISNQVEVINKLFYNDLTNSLWVGTNKGVLKIVLENEFIDFENLKISHYTHNKAISNSLDNNNINAILKDNNNNIWISTNGNYLNKYNVVKDNFDRVLIENKTKNKLNHFPKQIYIDSEENFWIGNDLSNLILWNRKTNKISYVSHIDKQTPIYDIYEDKNGFVWVSTDGFGLYIFDKNFDKLIKHIDNDPLDAFSLPNNQPTKIFQDKNGIFWFGSYNKGVSKLNTSKDAFGHYYCQPNSPSGLNGEIVQSVLEDSNQNIWLGVYGKGLNLFNDKNEAFKHFTYNPKDNNSLSSNKILYLFEDSFGYIWICTFDGGLNRFNPKTNTFKRFLHSENHSASIAQNSVWTGIEDSKNRIWLGYRTEGLGLYNHKTGNFKNYKNNLLSNFIFSLFIDSKNRLFIGTSKGLNVVDLNTLNEDTPETINFTQVNKKGIKDQRINYITEDYLGNIWLGADSGLYKLDTNLNLLKTYTSNKELPNNLVVGLVEDNNNNLWITTKGGISKLNPRTDNFKNFNTSDGLQGPEYQSKSIEKTTNGFIIAGGLNGLNYFNPENITTNSAIMLKPKISSFSIDNRKINSGDSINGRVILTKDISATQNLTLKYDENNISFGFEAVFLTNPNQIEYLYRMDKVDEEFVNSGLNKSVNYSNLQPGNYTFEVMASIDETWENAQSSKISFTILLPPWKTWWAHMLYFLFAILLFWIITKYYTLKVQEAQKHELDQTKLRFFVNVSHEFRTPLTLILNPIDKILANLNDSSPIKSSAITIQRSARRLLHLVNQLLDQRKMEVGMAPIQLAKGDVVKFGRDIFLLFKDLANKKQLVYKFESNSKKVTSFFDFDKVEKIITNLISNAIKFTENGGEVTVLINKIKEGNEGSKFVSTKEKLTEYLEIIVKDTGRGLSEEQIKNIFSRFYSKDSTMSGTGIGLNFTKALVNFHGGHIHVESKLNEGSRFIVKLPLKKNVKTKEVKSEKNEFLINSMKAIEYDMLISNETSAKNDDITTKKDIELPTLLIVEDNKELRVHLKNDLKKLFLVKEATNGEEGLKMVKKYFPDIIISDVMMPKMSGFEMCKKIKTELETCHIPVILLTARTLEEDRIEGYENGADEYLSKPFRTSVLMARINNLLEAKKRLRDKFSKLGANIPSEELTTNSLDQAFLEKVTNIVYDNISDVDFKLDDILEHIGLSSSQFYRKIRSITGQNPSNFIRTVRLNFASKLLLKNEHTIKEISYMSGFNSTSYFGKTFKQKFGLAPKDFIKEKVKKD